MHSSYIIISISLHECCVYQIQILREFDFPFTLYKLLTRYFTRSTNRGTLKNEYLHPVIHIN